MFTRMLPAGIMLMVILFSGCGKREEPLKVNPEKKEPVELTQNREGEKRLRIAVGGMITPKEGLAYYKRFLDYVQEKAGMRVDFIDREDYAEINSLLRQGNLDAAFICSGPYVDARKEFGLEILAAPQAYGDTVYYAFIIVHKNSKATKLEDLRGKKFAFTDPLSNTGTLVPTYMLARMGETPESFFEEHIFSQAHDKSIRAVAQGIVDGASVDSLIWEYLNHTTPELTQKTRIIAKSPPYGIPPVAVSNKLDPKMKQRLREIFLNAHKDEKGRAILNKMLIDKFVPIEDSAYNSVREMKDWLSSRQNTPRKNK